MKAFACSVLTLFCFCGSGLAQQARRAAAPPELFESVSAGNATGGAVSLSIADAIERALKYNLGAIIGEQQTRASRASRLRALSELLPKLNLALNETVQQTNLAAFGFGGFPGTPQVVGPFSVFDVRARYSQTVVDFRLLHELRSEVEQVAASGYGQQDVRELVVLITTNLYLEAIAGSSRLDAAQAQMRTAQAVYDRAVALKDSGVLAGIDVLRAQVQLRAQQQRVVAAENELAKQKLNLARAIGLPQGQAYAQTDSFAVSPMTVPTLEQALATAYESRADYKRSAALVRAAEESRKAAEGRRMPSLQINADYGDIGRTPAFSHGTMGLGGSLVIPLYAGERARAEILESESILEQRKAESANVRGRIEYEVRTAGLDIRSAGEQVEVARAARELAQQQLVQAQDRFAAGVANGLEVTQAQEAVAAAEENYISGLYGLNLAEAALARAMGTAEKTIKSFFGGK